MFNLPRNQIIYVSCSGGADSSLLLYELTKYHKDVDIRPIHFYKDDVPVYVRQEKINKIFDLISKLNSYEFKDIYFRKTDRPFLTTNMEPSKETSPKTHKRIKTHIHTQLLCV